MRKLIDKLFYEYHRTGDNDIIGPGFKVYHERRFSYGKVNLMMIIGVIIVVVYELYFK